DGDTDEGFDLDLDGITTCGGDCNDADPAISPLATETCNGVDDDCDGQVDEDGDADGDGVTACAGDCDDNDPDAYPGNNEVCDGIDNDCDNLLDILPDGSPVVDPEPCATGLAGQCAQGHLECSAAGQVVCRADTSPEEEVCDEEDNDCDGAVDEGTLNECGTCGATPVETCNGVDDDCDGDADEDDDLCPAGQACTFGECAEGCNADQACPAGLFCTNNRCVSFCAGVECGRGESCNEETGLCEDPCDGIECADGEVCFEGECQADDCYAVGCPDGEICGEGECQEDPCTGVQCGVDSFCRGGQCVFSCAGISCAFGQACIDGQCEDVRCGGVVCGEGQACAEDQCIEDECVAEDCGPGRTCLGGACADDPCTGVNCPANQRCEVNDGTAQCVADWNRPTDPQPDGGAVDEDGGTGAEDAGVDPADSNVTPTGDSGTGQIQDAGEFSEGGVVVQDDENQASSCACDVQDTSPGPLTWLLAVLLPAGLIRRRRR
ncbi:MAG: hypothetical protein GY882_07245, partial [Actinomycetia bacterium]|nr:hypothetical protein [Actinomycetes bacterium]